MPSLPEWVGPLMRRFYPSKYRIAWSEDLQELCFGEWIPKYGRGRNRWILEKWCVPPARSTWGELEEKALGPYPNNGTWEHCYTFEMVVNEGEEAQPVPLEFSLVELIIRAIEAGKMRFSDAQRAAALKERQEKIEQERKKLFDDLWDDSRPAVHAKIPEHIEMMDSFSPCVKTTADVPEEFRNVKQGFSQIGADDAKVRP